MKKILIIMIIAMALMPFTAAAIAPSYNYIDWNHQNGATFTSEMLDCSGYNAENPDTGWLHWVLLHSGSVTGAEIKVGDGEWIYMDSQQGTNIDFYTEPYYTEDELKSMTVTVRYTGTLDGNGFITLSHYCPGENTEVPEFPTIAVPIAAIIGIAFLMQRRKE
jgi:hypothetical protein